MAVEYDDGTGEMDPQDGANWGYGINPEAEKTVD